MEVKITINNHRGSRSREVTISDKKLIITEKDEFVEYNLTNDQKAELAYLLLQCTSRKAIMGHKKLNRFLNALAESE